MPTPAVTDCAIWRAGSAALVAVTTMIVLGIPELAVPGLAVPGAAPARAWGQVPESAERSTAEDDRRPRRRRAATIEHVARDVEGWTVYVDPQLLSTEHAPVGEQGLRILENKLYEITLIVPADRVARLREVPIYMDWDHPLTNLQYHPSAGWLRQNGYDPAMAKAVHIPRVQRLISLARNNTQPAVIVHELAHAYHDRVLGFNHRPIREAYERAVESRRYERVLHISGRTQRHYALTDHKEFFAEMTESFFGTNDFYPFVRAELAEYDAETFELLRSIWTGGR